MEKKIYLKNSFYSVLNYTLLIILSLLVRKVLILYFPIEYTGYEALFSDIFTLLSIADMGMESIITYNLYEQISRDKNSIGSVMELARKLYQMIAMAVLVLGGVAGVFLPLMFHNEKYDFTLLLTIYIIQVCNLSISYLTGYKRLLLIADQKEYICLKWDSKILVFIQISRIFILGIFKNYLLYVGLCIVQTLLQNIGISRKCNKEYGKLYDGEKEKGRTKYIIRHDIGNFLCHRISSVIYSATDNVVITAMLGLATTGLYSNYYMVAKYTYSLATKIMKPMQATIGNYLYSKTSDKDKIVLLETLNAGAFIFACFICNSLVQLSTPFIIIWLGNKYVQDNKLVVLLAINIFIAINQDFVYYFRNSYGKYEFDKTYMMMSSIVNFGLSVILSKIWGLSGIVLATIAGHLFIWYGRVKFVYIEIFKMNMNKYWKNQVKKIGLLCLQLFVTHLLTRNLGITIQDCIIREMIVILFLLVNIFWFFTPRWLKGWYCRH